MPVGNVEQSSMDAARLIAFLNAINVGELEGIRAKLEQAKAACVELEQQALAELVSEAEAALFAADMKTYRKRIATVIARLGHLK